MNKFSLLNENKVTSFIFVTSIVMAALMINCEPTFAKELTAAAKSYTDMVKHIAQALSVTGIVAGGALMQIPGASSFGKTVLTGGLVGGICAFGAPAFQSLLSSVFGG